MSDTPRTDERVYELCNLADEEGYMFMSGFARTLERENADLTAACQIFTQAFGPDGYLPVIGEPKTRRALELMRRAGVKPVHFGETPS